MRLIDRPKPLMQMRPDVLWPMDVQRVMDRALERDLAQRYQTATDFAADFIAAIDRMVLGAAQTAAIKAPAVAVPGAGGALAGSPSPRSSRRAPTRLALLGIAGVVVALGGGALWYRQSRAGLQVSTTPSPPKTGTTVGAADSTKTRLDTAHKRDTTGRLARKPDRPSANGPDAAAKTQDVRPPEFVIPTPQLRVRDVDLPSQLQQATLAAASAVNGVRVVENAKDPADIALRFANGRLVVESQNVRDAMQRRLDTAAAVNALAAAFRHEVVIRLLAALDVGASGPAVDLRVGKGKSTFVDGDTIDVHIRPARGGYLTLVDVDAAGTVTVLHPSAGLDVGHVSDGKQVDFNREFNAGKPYGNGVLRAIMTTLPLKLRRDGEVTIALDGPALAIAICRAVKEAGGDWQTRATAYSVSAKEKR